MLVQDSKKFGCAAQVKMKEIMLFPSFKVITSIVFSYLKSYFWELGLLIVSSKTLGWIFMEYGIFFIGVIKRAFAQAFILKIIEHYIQSKKLSDVF